jgi:hypothetical protein
MDEVLASMAEAIPPRPRPPVEVWGGPEEAVELADGLLYWQKAAAAALCGPEGQAWLDDQSDVVRAAMVDSALEESALLAWVCSTYPARLVGDDIVYLNCASVALGLGELPWLA